MKFKIEIGATNEVKQKKYNNESIIKIHRK